MYVHENILIPIIIKSRLSDPKNNQFRSDLGFYQINLMLKFDTISDRINKKIYSK